jgi:hypothetical protein
MDDALFWDALEDGDIRSACATGRGSSLRCAFPGLLLQFLKLRLQAAQLALHRLKGLQRMPIELRLHGQPRPDQRLDGPAQEANQTRTRTRLGDWRKVN